MKKISIAVFIYIIVISSVGYIEYNIFNIISNKKDAKEVLEMAYFLIENDTNNENKQENSVTQVSNINNKENVLYSTVQTLNSNFVNNINKKKHEKQIILNDYIIGILIIPKLNIEAPIKEGTSQEVMKTSIGHFIESDYWNGNVSLASHNSGTSAHYFSKINKLKENDKIKYITKFGTKTYKVESINKIKSTDWNMIVKSNSKTQLNTINLITCINGQKDYRLCVRAKEI